ncbi:MAG: ATP-binding protein [Verrucomicrobiaceae bacterium]|nr:MAG: ATP-binding protein [Verrucomicrobiaceae bacterium]
MTGPALAKAREILPLMLHDGILILLGSTGRGKTVMAAWWAWQRLLAGRSCGRFLTAYQLFARMKQCWTRGEDADAALRGWRTSSFLAIDELQTRAGSDWENAVLDELINARYAARLPTVLLGNLEPGDEQEALGPRILDRARECGGVIHCGWGSYRE